MFPTGFQDCFSVSVKNIIRVLEGMDLTDLHKLSQSLSAFI